MPMRTAEMHGNRREKLGIFEISDLQKVVTSFPEARAKKKVID